MPIKFIPTCKHCGQPIAQKGDFFPWYHTARAQQEGERLCDPADPKGSTLAIPKITIVKRDRKEEP